MVSFSKKSHGGGVFNSNIKGLTVPYLITAVLTLLLKYLFEQRDVLEYVEELLFAHGGPKNTLFFPTTEWIGPIWFLMALFWCRIYYQVIFVVCQRNSIWALICSFVISLFAVLIGRSYINLPLGMLTGLGAVGFYSLGAVLKRVSYKLSVFHLSFLVVLWIASLYFRLSSVDMTNFGYTFYPLNFLTAAGGTALVYLFSSYFGKATGAYCLAKCGEYSLDILCVHQLILCVCDHMNFTFPVYFLVFFVLPFASAMIHYLIDNYCCSKVTL